VTGKLAHYAPGARKVHVDLDAAELNKVVPVDVAILGDLRQVLEQLMPLVGPASHQEWLNQIDQWRAETDARDIANRPQNGRLLPPHVVSDIWEATQGEAILVTDVGQHQMWAAQYYHQDGPHPLITSGGLGTMGFGLPAAIGAQIARPDEEVWAIVGDGGFQMTAQELGTVVQEQLPLRIALFNNSFLGMVRQCWRVTKPEDTRQAIAEARSHRGPAFIEFQVAQEGAEGNVYPMVPAGAALHEMIRRPIPAVEA
jgi:acetolactate synthase-1/2/3 large subunit